MARRKYDRGEIVRLRESGLSSKQVAQIIGCSVSLVQLYAKQNRDEETPLKIIIYDPFQNTTDKQLLRILKLTRNHLKDCMRRAKNNHNFFERSIMETLRDMLQAYRVLRLEAKSRGLAWKEFVG